MAETDCVQCGLRDTPCCDYATFKELKDSRGCIGTDSVCATGNICRESKSGYGEFCRMDYESCGTGYECALDEKDNITKCKCSSEGFDLKAGETGFHTFLQCGPDKVCAPGK